MKNLKIIICLVLLASNSFASDFYKFGNRKPLKPSILTDKIGIKFVPSGLLLSTIGVQGEYVLANRVSVTLTYNKVMDKYLPKFFGVADKSFSKSTTMYGYMFTPEIRFYLNVLKDAPEGIYIAPYLRISHLNIEAEGKITVHNLTSSRDIEASAEVDYNAFGGGALLGYQKKFFNILLLDFYLLGFHMNKANVNGVITSPDINTLSVDEYNSMAERLETKQFATPRLMKSGNEIQVSYSGANIPGFRFGMALGLLF